MVDLPGRSAYEPEDDRADPTDDRDLEESGWGSPVPAEYGSLHALHPPERRSEPSGAGLGLFSSWARHPGRRPSEDEEAAGAEAGSPVGQLPVQWDRHASDAGSPAPAPDPAPEVATAPLAAFSPAASSGPVAPAAPAEPLPASPPVEPADAPAEPLAGASGSAVADPAAEPVAEPAAPDSAGPDSVGPDPAGPPPGPSATAPAASDGPGPVAADVPTSMLPPVGPDPDPTGPVPAAPLAAAAAPLGLDPGVGYAPAPDLTPPGSEPLAPAGPRATPPLRPARRPGRARNRVVVRHVDVASVAKVSALFYGVTLLVIVVAAVLLWIAADVFGTLPSIEKSVRTLFSLSKFKLHVGEVAVYTAAAGVVIAVVGTLANILLALIYNLIAEVVGGVRAELESFSRE